MSGNLEALEIRFVQWGKGRHHVHIQGEDQTLCGRDIPWDNGVRSAIYKPAVCARCEKADPGAVEAAEASRKAAWERLKDEGQADLERKRAGHFEVYRCKVCGNQLHNVHNTGSGVLFCVGAATGHHQSEPERVEATGPEWVAA